MFILLTLLVAAAGGLIAMRLKIPAGALIGSVIAVSIFNIFTGQVHFSSHFKVITQAVAGGFIGLGMHREAVRALRRLVVPAVFVAVIMNLQGLFLGYLVYYLAGIDLVTALISTAPGGIVDMSIMSMDMGADTTTVALLHTFRLIGVILLFPPMVKPLVKRLGHGELDEAGETAVADGDGLEVHGPEGWAALPLWKRIHIHTKACLPTLGIALGGGSLGYLFSIPAGVLLFSLIAVSAFNLKTHKAYIPGEVKRAAQMLAGVLIGQGVGMEQVRQLSTLLLPAIGVLLAYLCFNALSGLLLYKFFNVDLVTGLLSASPAGASDMALIAADLGAQSSSVAVLHIVRLISVIALYPQLVLLLTSF